MADGEDTARRFEAPRVRWRLWAAAGLSRIVWAGEVRESTLIAEPERRNHVHPRHDPQRFDGLRHWVLPLKEVMVEVVADSVEVARVNPASYGDR